MNKITIVHKGIVVMLLCIILCLAILRKVLASTFTLKNESERIASELLQKKTKLSIVDNLNTREFTIKKYVEIQSNILTSVNSDPKVNVTRFSEIQNVKDTKYIDYDFTITGSQSNLLIWLNTFENDYKDAIIRSTVFESKKNSEELLLSIYLRSMQR